MASNFLISESDFTRMCYHGNLAIKEWIHNLTYEDFITWNKKCIAELSEEDEAWIVGLCKRMKAKTFMFQDIYHCSRFVAYTFYFDMNKNIIITNPQ